MKMYSITIEAITMDSACENIIKTQTQAYVPANSRGEAINVACDMGQAMARSTNALKDIALYYRIVGVQETEQGIA